MQKSLRIAKSFVLNLYFLLFMNGFLIAFFIFCRIQADYENRLFANIANIITSGEKQTSQENLIRKAVKTTNHLLQRRTEIFKDHTEGGFLDDIIHPLSIDITTAEGACGSYSAVLCRVLNAMNIPARLGQMKVNGVYGGHIIAEAKTNNGWVVLDPIDDLYFTRPDGHLASFEEVSASWQWYKKQTPAGYNPHYTYDAVRYTNWHKIPVIMPMAKTLLAFFIEKNQLEKISLRTYFLKRYTVVANLLLLLILPISVFILVRLLRPVLRHKLVAIPNLLEPQNKTLVQKHRATA